jgi:hypothetical protein
MARTAKDVIDQAIRENRLPAILLYFFSMIFVGTGVTVLVVGTVHGQGIVALAGALGSAPFIPAVRLTQSIRRENMSIRLLEVPLTKATTAEEAARLLQEFFANTLVRANNSRVD